LPRLSKKKSAAREARQPSISHCHTERRNVGRPPDMFRPTAEESVTEL
jgi:hypothetical protein